MTVIQHYFFDTMHCVA